MSEYYSKAIRFCDICKKQHSMYTDTEFAALSDEKKQEEMISEKNKCAYCHVCKYEKIKYRCKARVCRADEYRCLTCKNAKELYDCTATTCNKTNNTCTSCGGLKKYGCMINCKYTKCAKCDDLYASGATCKCGIEKIIRYEDIRGVTGNPINVYIDRYSQYDEDYENIRFGEPAENRVIPFVSTKHIGIIGPNEYLEYTIIVRDSWCEPNPKYVNYRIINGKTRQPKYPSKTTFPKIDEMD